MPDPTSPTTTRPAPLPSLIRGRGVLGALAWALTLAMALTSTVHAARSGAGWRTAAISLGLALGYTFLPWINAASARADERRRRQRAGTLTVDDWGVTRVQGDVREAVAWDDLAWVRIYTTSDGPGAEDMFFALGDGHGKGCLVPNELAVATGLLATLQARLPGLDNEAVARAAGSTTEAWFPIWSRPAVTPGHN